MSTIYVASKDYEALYELVDGGAALLTILASVKSPETVKRRAAKVSLHKGMITIGCEGVSYSDVFMDDPDPKADFVRDCKRLDLEWMKPKTDYFYDKVQAAKGTQNEVAYSVKEITGLIDDVRENDSEFYQELKRIFNTD